jgi:DNA-binding FadR family transcriptional regulator
MILKEKVSPEILSEFMRYLADVDDNQASKLPPLQVLSEKLGISVAILREQLEVARALGLVEVRPHRGIRRQPYSFFRTIRQSMAYALLIEPDYFQSFSDLRIHIESTYWEQATSKLLPEDLNVLRMLVDRAEERLYSDPIQIPQIEHRELHLTIFKRLGNPFVLGLLEAYWEMYDAVGLNVFTDYDYLKNVWIYHRKMVDTICDGDMAKGKQFLIEHFNLLGQRSDTVLLKE